MRTFVIAYMNFFDNEMLMTTIVAHNVLDAVNRCSFLIDYMDDFTDIPNESEKDLIKSLKNYFFDLDSCFGILEIF